MNVISLHTGPSFELAFADGNILQFRWRCLLGRRWTPALLVPAEAEMLPDSPTTWYVSVDTKMPWRCWSMLVVVLSRKLKKSFSRCAVIKKVRLARQFNLLKPWLVLLGSNGHILVGDFDSS